MAHFLSSVKLSNALLVQINHAISNFFQNFFRALISFQYCKKIFAKYFKKTFNFFLVYKSVK